MSAEQDKARLAKRGLVDVSKYVPLDDVEAEKFYNGQYLNVIGRLSSDSTSTAVHTKGKTKQDVGFFIMTATKGMHPAMYKAVLPVANKEEASDIATRLGMHSTSEEEPMFCLGGRFNFQKNRETGLYIAREIVLAEGLSSKSNLKIHVETITGKPYILR